jgi:hypothetical protein
VLNAIIHGKAGRINFDHDASSVSWRQLYQNREDLLTAAFFSRFTYLSGLLQHRLLKQWLGGVGDFTTFEGIDYWPRYELNEYDDRNFVEPDLLIRFSDCDLLVEVKPPQGGNQYIEQWKLEIEGYYAQELADKPLYFLAIGRVGNIVDELDITQYKNDKDFQKAAAIEWQTIASQLRKLSLSGELDAQDSRIVKDMGNALSLYGIRAQNLDWSDLYKWSSEQPLSIDVLVGWPLMQP